MGNRNQGKTKPKIVQFCLHIIRPYLCDNADFHRDESLDIQYSLSANNGNYFTRTNSHGLSVPVLRMKNGFYMFCSIGFKMENRKSVLRNVSVQFYDEERIIFRAEWDNKDFQTRDKILHSQPHWHLEAKGVAQKESTASTYDEFRKESSFSATNFQPKSKQLDLGRLHFFMMLHDQSDDNPYYIDLTEEKLLKQWLSLCLESVDKELRFIASK